MIYIIKVVLTVQELVPFCSPTDHGRTDGLANSKFAYINLSQSVDFSTGRAMSRDNTVLQGNCHNSFLK